MEFWLGNQAGDPDLCVYPNFQIIIIIFLFSC